MTAVRILHIDDEPDIREVVAVSLALDPEFTVRCCASGEDGLVAAVEDPPDLILLDVMMPLMDGPTTFAHLREDPRTATIPVIFVTARAFNREIEQFKLLGAAGVIAKPFDPMTLAAAVRSHMHPVADNLAESRVIFLRRLSDDADALLRCRPKGGQQTISPSLLVRIRDIAHGLAGAGGIFGFPEISQAAAGLEKAAIYEINGTAAPQKIIEIALDHLLTRIQARVPLQIAPTHH